MKNLNEVLISFHTASRDLDVLWSNEVEAKKKDLFRQAFAEALHVLDKLRVIVKFENDQAAWGAYEKLLAHHNEFWEAKKPNIEHYDDPKKFQNAMSEWHRCYHMDMPNKPGYEVANND